MASYKAEICLKKKITPRTNIPLLSLRMSEQQLKETTLRLLTVVIIVVLKWFVRIAIRRSYLIGPLISF